MASIGKEERIRLQHERFENERRFYNKKFDTSLPPLPATVPAITSEETRLRKQKERLENEKLYYKQRPFLTKDRRLVSLTKLNESLKSKSKSTHDKYNVKSKLFDYEKSTPRSIRQLSMDSGSVSPPSRGHKSSQPRQSIQSDPSESHGIQSQLVQPIGVTPGVTTSAQSSKTRLDRHKTYTSQGSSQNEAYQKNASGQGSTSRLNSQNEANQRAESGQTSTSRLNSQNETIESLATTSLEKEASSRRNLVTHVSFDENAAKPKTSPRGKNIRSQSLPAPNLSGIDEEQTKKLQALYNRAVDTVQKADESRHLAESNKHTTKCSDRRCSVKSHTDLKRKSSGVDVLALKELETILQEARLYSSRKSNKEDHNRLDLGSNRAQKKRIQHLEQVLRQLNPHYGTSTEEIDPMKVLQCSYLRLSKSNVEALEAMLRESGRDPGIHIHSDVTKCDIWRGLKQERSDLKVEPTTSDSKKTNCAKKTAKT